MDTTVAETVARSTREQAASDARSDLQELRRQAVEAGRERSRKIAKTSRIDPRTGEIRYNPAGRLLRDWYLHVYINQLRARLGEPSVSINAQQVEDTTAMLRRLRPNADGHDALRAVGVLRATAIDDAATAAVDIVEKLRDVGERRAIQHAPDDRFDSDELRIHVTRHWYLRCYQDQIERSTDSQMPLTAVTDAETAQVALVLNTRIPVRFIGENGIPLITDHATAMTEVDRQLALGGTHLVSSLTSPLSHTDPFESLGSRLPREWNRLDNPIREYWLARAGAEPRLASSVWSAVPAEAQTKIIRMYLRAEGPKQNDWPFVGTVIDEPPAVAAQVMFAHGSTLVEAPSPPVDRQVASAQDAHVELLAPGLTTPHQGISVARGAV